MDFTATNTTAESDETLNYGIFIRDKVTVWVHLAILILGMITNPLVIVVLSSKQVGSEY